MPNTKPAVQATPAVSEPAHEVEAELAREVEAEPVREVGAKRGREVEAEPPASGHAHGGWSIQIGAFDGENEAKEHLSAARLKMRGALVGYPSLNVFREGIRRFIVRALPVSIRLSAEIYLQAA